MRSCRSSFRSGALVALLSLFLAGSAPAQQVRFEGAVGVGLRSDAVRPVGPAERRAIASPVAPERMRAALEGRIELTPEENFARIVHIAYGQLSRYAANAGHDLRFEIDDLWTLRRDEFDTVLALDLYTLPTGAVVDVVPTRHRSEIDDFAWAEYKAKWRDHGDEIESAPEAQRLPGMTLAEILVELSEADPSYATVQRATSAEITVHLDGRQRTYRALFLWLQEGAGEEWKRFDVLAIDNVTQGVAESLLEQFPIEGRRLGARPSREGVRSVTAASGTACVANTTSFTRVKNPAAGTNSHISGGHKARVDIRFTCSCDTGCNSTCSATTSNEACFDTGFTSDSCHKMSSAADTSDGIVQNSAAQGVGASCAGGFQCAQRACLFCTCNTTVGVTVVGSGISFASASQADWHRNLAANTTCAPCEATTTTTTQPPPGGGTPPNPYNQDPPPDPGDGPGTSTCAALDCTWTCTGTFNPTTGTYSESCHLDCRCIG